MKISLSAIVLLLLSKGLLLEAQEITLKPAGKLQLRYEDATKKYTKLGQAVHNKNKLEYNDYIVGGMFGVQALWESYTLKTLLYSVGRLHSKNENSLKNEKSFYNNNQDEFIYLGELSLTKEFDKHAITLGRQTYNTPLVNSNFRVTQNAYEGVSYYYDNENVNFKTLYFHKISSSTMSNNIPINHKYGFLGYGLGYNTSGYAKLSKHIINEDLSTNGAIHFLSSYKTKNSTISYENLYVDNFFNTSNLTVGYNFKSIYFKAGMIYQTSVGKKQVEHAIENTQEGKKLEAQHYQAQIKYQEGTFQLIYNVSLTPTNKNSIYRGTLLSPFSNQPTWLVGLNTSHATIADTLSQKVAVIKSTHIYDVPVVVAVAHIHYDIGKDNGLTPKSISTSESFFHLKGHLTKNLSAMLQYSYAKNYDLLTEGSYHTKMVLEYQF
ncbi:MAG: hypothetical protein WC141_07045 [Arcobacteraceae bacterium]